MFPALRASSSRLSTSVRQAKFSPTVSRQPIPSHFAFTRTYSSAPPLDTGEQAIHQKLAARFPGKRLEVQDVSGGCGSFYAILISSPAFNGLSTIKQHKLVNECLKDDIKGIHGLQLKTIPEDA